MQEPRREDVESIDGILKALYEVISGPPGPRDWDRERTLMAPGARLMPTRCLSDEARAVDVLDLDGYIASRSPFFAANHFLEHEVARRVERFGAIAHVWSTYVSRHTAEEEPFARGINSIQLFHDGARWWVLSAVWDIERTDNPLPAEYLPAAADGLPAGAAQGGGGEGAGAGSISAMRRGDVSRSQGRWS